MLRPPVLALVVALLVVSACGGGADVPGAGRASSRELLLASTTSTQDSGLLDVLLPAFEEESGYTVRLISGGSGQAIENGRRGDVDVLLVHSPEAELAMVAAGDGIERAPVMHNDFVLVGPADDPAGVRAAGSIDDALRVVAAEGARFISRGDESGTHVRERALWREAGVEPQGEAWYEESGQGQGATLQIASQKAAYALTDRGTFLAQRKILDLEIVWQGGPGLTNAYHVIVINPEKHTDVNVEGARAWAAFVTGARGQALIASFGVEAYGEPLFFADTAR